MMEEPLDAEGVPHSVGMRCESSIRNANHQLVALEPLRDTSER
jgi:hypothetical protein